MEQERGEEEIGWKERKLFERSKVLNGLRHRHAVSGWKRSSWWAKSNFSKFVGHEAIFKADRSLILWFAMIRFWLMWNLVLHSCGYVPRTHKHTDAHTHTCALILNSYSASTQSHSADRPNVRDVNMQPIPKEKKKHPSAVGNTTCFPLVSCVWRPSKEKLPPKAKF